MLAFPCNVNKVIAPWVAAAVVIHYLNVYNEKNIQSLLIWTTKDSTKFI